MYSRFWESGRYAGRMMRRLVWISCISVEQLREGYSKTSTTPLGRSGKLTEVASTIAFLASEKAGYIHGTTINIAGGKTRG